MSGLSDDQAREAATIAELEVRRYFDHYLNDIFPEQMKAVRSHTYRVMEQHDGDRKAHGGVERKVNRYLWIGVGAAAVIGFLLGDGGTHILKLLK